MKRNQKRQNNQIIKRKGLTVFLILIFFLAFLKIIFLVKGSLWNENYRLNLIVKQADDLVLMTLEPKEPLLTVLKIPPNLYLEVPYGYGNYQAQALSKLEAMEKKPNLVLKTIQDNFAIYLDGQIEIEGADLSSKKETEKKILGLFFGKGKTNFSSWDILRLWWKIRSLKENEYKYLDIKKMALTTTQKLPDKSEIYLLDKATFDMKIQKIFVDPVVRLENLTVEILNGTDHPGLAEKAARILNNSSLSVVSTGNTDLKADKSYVETEKKLSQTRTITLVKNILNCFWVEKRTERRADVTLIIGEDYFQFLTQK